MGQRMFMSTILMLTLGLWAELCSSLYLKIALGIGAVVASEYSVLVVDRYQTSRIHHTCRIVFYIYGIVFFVGMYSPNARIFQEIALSLLDTLVKGGFSFYTVAKAGDMIQAYRQLFQEP